LAAKLPRPNQTVRLRINLAKACDEGGALTWNSHKKGAHCQRVTNLGIDKDILNATYSRNGHFSINTVNTISPTGEETKKGTAVLS
jgi:hypothetical protein